MPNPEELDPTTARLVSELSASMLPTLSKSLNSSLNSAVHLNEFMNAIDRTNMVSQDLRNQVEKALRSNVDEGRANRSMILQSMRAITDEITSLRKLMDKVPETLDYALKNNKPDDNNNAIILQELAGISEIMKELIQGIQNLSEVYASDKASTQNFEPMNDSQILNENNTRLDKLINNSLPGLEGLVKAHEKSQSHELEEFSRELSTLHEQNNLALIHEIKNAVAQELEAFHEEFADEKGTERDGKSNLLLKIIAGMSGACAIFSFLTLLMMLLR